MKRERIGADYLFIPGDISDSAQPDEFILASEVISEISNFLQVPLDKIVSVPGNHDVDWTVTTNYPHDQSGFRRAQRYQPLQQNECIFRQIMANGVGNLLEFPYFTIWEFDDLLVVGYNSSWQDSPEIPTHHGEISSGSLDEIQSNLDKIDTSHTRLKIFLVHHHPVQYSDPIPNEPDFSAMTNAENLLTLLRTKQFDMLIHGHKHSPRFQSLSIDSGFPLAILCAGSFSRQLDTRWSGHVNNQFHLIHVDERDDATKCIAGYVDSWTYLSGSSWMSSQPQNGIIHRAPFGTYVQPNQLASTLRPIIEQELNAKEFVSWDDLISVIPYLAYLPTERTVEVLDNLASELGYHRHGTPPDKVILLKGKG